MKLTFTLFTHLLLVIPIVNASVIQKSLITISAPCDPVAFDMGGKSWLVYELHLTNKSVDNVALEKIVIESVPTGLRKTLEARDLQRCFQNRNVKDTTQSLSLEPNGSGVVYVELSFEKGTVASAIRHRVVTIESGVEVVTTFDVARSSGVPVILGAPLGSGKWAAVFSADWERGHRRVIYNRGERDRIPGRFAIDFIKVNDLGQYAEGDEDIITHWYGYGLDVLAVADGVIGSVRNDFSESKTLSAHPGYAPDMSCGNYISLKLDKGHYVFYEHLKPESIIVKKGERVRKGQVIAKVGFTGQTTGPHLHLHVADTDSPLAAEGLPFAFEKFKPIGHYPDFSIFGKAVWTPAVNGKAIVKEHPQSNSIISFE